jgi:hypothetical protein
MLGELSEKDIKDKLLSLAWAQHVILPDHPESLFVPAFLRETIEAQKLARPEKTLQEYKENNLPKISHLEKKTSQVNTN